MADTIRLLTDLLYTRLTNFATIKYPVVVKKTGKKYALAVHFRVLMAVAPFYGS